MNKRQGQWKAGIWIPASNNPKGHNKHTPKEQLIKNKPKKEKKITIGDVQQAYREKLKARNEYLSKSQIYARLHNTFLGLDKIEEEEIK